MHVLVVEPERRPEVWEIDESLEAMQEIVGGLIQPAYPFDDPVTLVCNDEGKLLGLPANRGLRGEDGQIYDIVCGTFFLCGAPPDSDHFTSLTLEQLERYRERFYTPEMFWGMDRPYRLLAVGGPMMKELWIRIGAAVRITDTEVRDIFSDDEVKMREALRRVIAEARFCPDGETYVPNKSVREFNRTYGTACEEDEWFCD